MNILGAWSGGWLPRANTLILTGNVCGDFDIFSVDADGRNLQNYTHSLEWDLYPRLSPDGSTIAATRISITETGVDGNRISTITLIDLASGEVDGLISGEALTLRNSIPFEEVWSPDGRYVVLQIEGGHGACEA